MLSSQFFVYFGRNDGAKLMEVLGVAVSSFFPDDASSEFSSPLVTEEVSLIFLVLLTMFLEPFCGVDNSFPVMRGLRVAAASADGFANWCRGPVERAKVLDVSLLLVDQCEGLRPYQGSDCRTP